MLSGASSTSNISIDSEKIEKMKFQDVNELIEAIITLKLQLKQERKSKLTLAANTKAVAFKESIEFLKEKSRAVTDMLTRNHRKIVQQFMEFKKQTNWRIQEFEEK